MTHITCRLTAKNWDQLRNPTLGYRVWAAFFYTPVNFRSTGTGVLCQLSLDQRTRRSSQRLSELSQISASRVDLENTTNQTRSLAKIAQRTDINIPDRSTVRHDGEGQCTISSQIHLFSLIAIRGGVLE